MEVALLQCDKGEVLSYFKEPFLPKLCDGTNEQIELRAFKHNEELYKNKDPT